MDVCHLDSHKADFVLDRDVDKAFLRYRNTVQTQLSKHHAAFRGHLSPIGSCRDGSKIGRVNETDCLYVIDGSNIDAKATGAYGQYQIFFQGKELKARKFNVEFADCIEEALMKVELPQNLQHGGYAAPHFSGVRFCGPAVTSLYECQSGDGLSFPVSLDVTAAFPVPIKRFNKTVDDVTSKLRDISKENYGKSLTEPQIHLVPHPLKDVWQLSTAHIEANLLRDLQEDWSIKSSLHNSKAVVHLLEKQSSVQGHQLEQFQSPLAAELRRYQEMKDGDKQVLRRKLNQRMRYEHIYLSRTEREEFSEMPKKSIAINTAAVKHIILRSALREVNVRLCSDEMMREVFRELSDRTSYTVPHALLPGICIGKFSVLPSLGKHGATLARERQQQCQLLLYNAMTEVRKIRILHILNVGKKTIGNLCERQ